MGVRFLSILDVDETAENRAVVKQTQTCASLSSADCLMDMAANGASCEQPQKRAAAKDKQNGNSKGSFPLLDVSVQNPCAHLTSFSVPGISRFGCVNPRLHRMDSCCSNL